MLEEGFDADQDLMLEDGLRLGDGLMLDEGLTLEEGLMLGGMSDAGQPALRRVHWS